MFQVTFSEQSMQELNKLQVPDQMAIVEQISSLTEEQLEHPREPLGRFARQGKIFYRLRAGDFRCYFECRGSEIFNHYFLHKNTLSDFIFRSKLPVSEEMMVEQYNSFWKYLDSLKKK